MEKSLLAVKMATLPIRLNCLVRLGFPVCMGLLRDFHVRFPEHLAL
jgi:hypothetical protein